jgi:hypothetical protein
VQLAELREIVSAWIAELGVEVVFDPETPAGLRDYILGGSLGVVDGAFKGAAIGLFIGALFDAPGTGLIVGAGLGGAVGAAGGVQAISNGHRVRIRAWWADGEPVAVLEAA